MVIRCPAGCPYLGEHEGYQGRKAMDGESVWRRRYQDAYGVGEDALNWTLLLDRALCGYLLEHPDTSPAEVWRSLEFLRSKASPLLTPVSPATALEGFLQDALEGWKKAPGGRHPGDRDALLPVLEQAIPFFRATLDKPGAIREFLRSVAALLGGEPGGLGQGNPGSADGESAPTGGGIIIP